MKNLQALVLMLTILLTGLATDVSAQTDVTNQYLTNAGFDDQSSWQTDNVAATGNSNSKDVAGWTLEKDAAWSSSAAFGFGTAGQINGLAVPATGADGTATGGCLGISTGWGGVCQYSQEVTFQPGKYRISYAACNVLEGKTQSYNFIGFIPNNGTATYGVINNFLYGQWMEDEIIVELKEATSGKISVGLGAVSEGSNNNAKVAIDYVKIEAWNAAEAMMPGNDIAPGTWTGNTGTYNNNEYLEHYEGNHYTGEVMTSTTSVENGTYSADVFFHAHMAWIGQVATDGTLNAFINANGTKRLTEVVNNTGFAAYEPKCYHLDNIQVTDGALKLSVGNEAEGANWLTVKTKKITQMTTPYVSYGAFPLPEEAVKAGYWYRVDVPMAGSYNLTTGGTTTVAYTQNATELTSASFSTTTGGDLTLAAGALYLRSSEAVTLALATTSYGYNIGNATTDKEYVQPGQLLTVSFADAITTDPHATLTQDYSGVRLNGNSLQTTSSDRGFSFVVPDLAAGGEYTLEIPAGAIAYEGKQSNTAQTLVVKTASAYDGTYFLKNQAGYFLARGNDWGTHAIMDPWGLPVKVSTDAANRSTIQFVDNGNYLFNTGYDAYTDATATEEKTQWVFSLADGAYRLASVQQNGKFTKYNNPDGNLFTDGEEGNGTIVAWTLQQPAEHAAEMAALKAELTTLSGSIEGLTSKTYLSSNPTQTDEQYQGEGEVMKGSINITAPGIYKFSIQAFHRLASNNVTYPLNQTGADCPPVYAFFGNAKVQLKSVFDEPTTGDTGFSIEGKNYPNGQGGALTAFKEGRYVNTIWVRIDEMGTYEYGIRNQGKATLNQHWTCYAKDGIEITRYYDPETDGLDEEDQLIASLRYTIGDVNEDRSVTVADVTELVNVILGKNTTAKEALANVNEDETVSIADVTELVNILLGKAETKTVDMTWTYANLDAQVYARQSANENESGANYMLKDATCSLTGEDVGAQYSLKDFLTTLHVSTTMSNVARMSIYALGNEQIAGPMTVTTAGEETSTSYSNGQATDYASSLESNVVSVDSPTAGTITAFLRPVELSKGVKVTIQTTDGKFFSQDFANISAGKENTLQFTQTSAQNLWMATIPGNTYFSMISTPSAHDAATSGCTSYTYLAKCQADDLSTLLANGVRAFDLRPGYFYNSEITADNLYIYHGEVSTNVLYRDAMRIFAEFLEANPTEAISIIMVKENNKPLLSSWSDRSREMWNAIKAIHSSYGQYMKLLDHSYYTLDDFRGKICYVNRTGTDCTNTVRITNWPDDGSVTDYSCAIGNTCQANVEDAYNANEANKKTAIKEMLDLASANTNHAHFHYVYTSIAGSLTSDLTAHAAVMNPYTANYVSNTLTGPTGYVYADYIGNANHGGAELLRTIVEQNFKYVFKGRSYEE